MGLFVLQTLIRSLNQRINIIRWIHLITYQPWLYIQLQKCSELPMRFRKKDHYSTEFIRLQSQDLYA